MNVTEAKCSKRHARLWWAIGLLFAAVLGLSPTIYSLYGVTYEAKAEAQNAASDTAKLKVEVEAHEVQAAEERGVVRDSLKTIEADVKTLLRNGGGD